MDRHPLCLAIARACASVLAGAAVLVHPPSHASGKGQSGSQLEVNSSASTLDGECGAAPGECTLADAIATANQDAGTPTTISFDDTVLGVGVVRFSSAVGGAALPPILGDVTILGNGGLAIERDAALGCTFNGRQDPDEFRLLQVNRTGRLELQGVTVRGGCVDAGNGGAILAEGELTLRGSTLVGNTATSGGGVSSSNSGVTLVDSTVSGNSAADNGGGIYAVGSDVTITQSTISGNTADNGGGAASLIGDLAGGGHSIEDATIAFNTATEGSGLYLGDVSLTLRRSLLAGDADGLCLSTSPDPIDAADSLATDETCDAVTVSLQELDLKTLVGAAGATAVHPLGARSVAIDAVAGACPQAADQRGEPRPFDGDGDGSDACDMGAFEVQELSQSGPDYEVNTASGAFDGICGSEPGGCSLPDAVEAANGASAPSVITVDPAIAGVTISLQTAFLGDPEIGETLLPALHQPLQIDGSGVIVTRSAEAPCARFLASDGMKLTLNDLTLSNGCSPDGGGALWLRNAELAGATVFLTANTASLGGAVYGAGVTVSGTNLTISGNTADVGGGFWLSDSVLSGVSVNVTGNSASGVGGGLAGYGVSVGLENGLVDGNTASTGGGFYLGEARTCCPDNVGLTLDNTTISANVANFDGGGIARTPSPANAVISLNRTTITGNTAGFDGGGIALTYSPTNASVSLNQMTITGNTAGLDGGGLSLVGAPSLMMKRGDSASAGAAVNGGGIDSATAFLTNSQILENVAQRGGGVYATAVNIHVANSAVSRNEGDTGAGLWLGEASIVGNTFALEGNSAAGAGGGIYAYAATADLMGSTISGNVAKSGGGIHLGEAMTCCPAATEVSLDQTTIVGNTADVSGGGLVVAGATVFLTNVSMVSNTADLGGGLQALGEEASLAISNSTLAGNTAFSTASQLAIASNLEAGAVTLSGNVFAETAIGAKGGMGNCDLGAAGAASSNFSTDSSCGDATVASAADLNLIGGEGDIPLPGPGSVLVDVFAGCTGVDQRGAPRGVDADGRPGDDCDVGAVEVQNTPVVGVDDEGMTDQDAAVSGGVLANDLDADDEDIGTLSVSSVAGDAGNVGAALDLPEGGRLTLRSDGGWDFDPQTGFVALDTGDVAVAGVTYRVADGYAEDDATLAISVDGVNDPPAAGMSMFATGQDDPVSGQVAGGDPDAGETLTYSVLVPPVAGSITAFDASSGSFTFEPGTAFRDLDDGENRSVFFTYRIADEAASDDGLAEIDVAGSNDPPVAAPDSYFVVAGELLTVPALTGLLANDGDLDGDALTVLSTGAFTPSGVGGTLTLAADGSFTFEAPQQIGTAGFDYMVGDGDAAATGALSIDVVVAESADLSIEKSDGRIAVDDGEVVTYVITVRNDGPAAVTGALVEDMLPPTLINATWTCTASTGAACSAAGAGDISERVDLDVGATATFSVEATVALDDAMASVTNTAAVTAPAGTPEVNADNNVASDVNVSARVFRSGFEPEVLVKRFDERTAKLAPASIDRLLRAASDPEGGILVLRACAAAHEPLALALVHARLRAGLVELQVSRYEHGTWHMGPWTAPTGGAGPLLVTW